MMKSNYIIISLFSIKILILFLLFNNLKTSGSEELFFSKFLCNDYSELLGPTNNLIETGTYELVKGSEAAYTDRLPGYMFPYVIFRYFFSENIAVPILIIFQILLSIIASFALFKLLNDITNKRLVSLFGMALYLFLPFSVPWELWTYPESLSLSAYVLSIYFFYFFYKNQKKLKYLILAGLFLAWMFYLRGFLAFYFIPPVIILAFPFYKNRTKSSFLIVSKRIVLFILALVIFESVWITRNYISKNEFIPLQTKFSGGINAEIEENFPFNSSYKPSIISLRELIELWGGQNFHLYPNSEMSYFLSSTLKDSSLTSYFPEKIFKEKFSKERIIDLRTSVRDSYNSKLDFTTRKSIEQDLLHKISELKSIFKEEHGSMFFYSSFKRIKNLIAHNVTSNWPGSSFSENNLIYKIYKLGVLALYFAVIPIAIVALIIYLRKHSSKKKTLVVALFANALLLIVTFAFLINIAEFKYFITGFVGLLMISLILLSDLIDSLPITKK